MNSKIKNLGLSLGIICLLTVSALAYSLPNFHYVTKDNIGIEYYVSDTKTVTPTGYSFLMKKVFTAVQDLGGVFSIKTVVYSEQESCSANTHDILTAEYFDDNGNSIAFKVHSWMGFPTKAGSVGETIKADVCR